MLIKNPKGETIQCVIDDSRKADFEALGFVDNDSKLKVKPKAIKPAKLVKPTGTVKNA
jgi:hypothetical protein